MGVEPDPAAEFEALAAEHLKLPSAGRRRMFGRDCLTVDGHNVAFRDGDRLALRLPPAVATRLLDARGAQRPRMGERTMNGWTAVDPGSGWAELLDQARSHVVGGTT